MSGKVLCDELRCQHCWGNLFSEGSVPQVTVSDGFCRLAGEADPQMKTVHFLLAAATTVTSQNISLGISLGLTFLDLVTITS